MFVNSFNQNGSSLSAEELPRGKEFRRYLAEVTASVGQLNSIVQSLPRLEADRRSESPFAEDLYAQKAELETQVSHDEAKLQRHLSSLEKEVHRCEHNLDQIGHDSTKLNVPAALDAYNTAEQDQRDEYYQALTDRDAVMLLLSWASSVLQVSRSRNHSGRIPERDPFGVPPKPLVSHTPGGPQRIRPSGPSLGGDAGEMFDMGPLPRSG